MRRLSGLSESGQTLQANQQQLTTSRQSAASDQHPTELASNQLTGSNHITALRAPPCNTEAVVERRCAVWNSCTVHSVGAA
ncbi:unnamed protein product [Ceratitis capitata]|uniref:(Mediterranean fruit fly) hypothetical protein n=1 Tax=Ceratitis capitata TaxID=7213 RepID=A0A811VD24_CERCA|nr:unnamed protein product [Ceratitis capitata]